MKIARLLLFTSLTFTLASCVNEDPIAPDTPDRNKFLGNWKVKEEIGMSSSIYLSTVTIDSSNTAGIKIGNIYNLGNAQTLKALVAGNTLDISQQSVTGILISGNGTFSGTQCILNYSANEGGDPQTVKATYTRP